MGRGVHIKKRGAPVVKRQGHLKFGRHLMGGTMNPTMAVNLCSGFRIMEISGGKKGIFYLSGKLWDFGNCSLPSGKLWNFGTPKSLEVFLLLPPIHVVGYFRKQFLTS